MAVELANLQRRVPISPRRIGRTARRALRDLGRSDALVNLTFVDDAFIRRLNRRFSGHDRPTDVLAFPLDVPGPSRLWGEIVISAETAGRQARRLGIAVGLELDLLVVHGLLHLAGYDDREAGEARLMHQREREILEKTAPPVPDRLWSGLLQG